MENCVPTPLKTEPETLDSAPTLNYHIMQSTGHETQAEKPGAIPLITLLKEPILPFSIVVPEIILLHFVLLILPLPSSCSPAFLVLTTAFSLTMPEAIAAKSPPRVHVPAAARADNVWQTTNYALQ